MERVEAYEHGILKSSLRKFVPPEVVERNLLLKYARNRQPTAKGECKIRILDEAKQLNAMPTALPGREV